MRFQDLKIDEAILKAIREIGYDQPTPIQEKAIPIVLEGHDLLGCAQTGTGKTAAFSIPMLQRMGRPQEGEARPVRGLILTPTRELALQIYENLCQYGRYLGRISAVIFGGVSQNPQVEAIQNGADILVATPGRLWDLMGQKLVDISTVECFVLDEADRMLDMGFINDVKRILKFLPKKRQTLLFSATMPEEIADLANNMLHKPRHVSIVPAATPVELIEQGVYFTDKKAKRDLLRAVLEERSLPQTLVFTRTKHGADRVARDLSRAGIAAKSIHGDKSQNARQNALKQFKDYKIPVLVATDIAARGIDINELPLVINFDLPNVPETYVHRIGRTGRAGQEGTALSFCDPSELPYLKDIEELTRVAIPALEPPAGIEIAEAQTAARYVRHDPTLPPEKPAKQDKKAKSNSHRGKKKSAEPAPVKAEPRQQGRKNESAKATAKPVQKAEPASKKQSANARGKKRTNNLSAANTRKKAAPAELPAREPTSTRAVGKTAPPRRKSAGRGGRPIMEPAYENITTMHQSSRKGGNRRGRREDVETRVDVMTPPSGRPLAPSTAARIRAKVEAKLAERRAFQSSGTSAQSRAKKQGKVQRKPQTRSGRGRARG
ncbi:DEAD/DEAH box helicase [Butyricicoccus pullicaecorum]|uniref:DEAD/DEAH box helicase n=1 Tax=Butyricicoccus pullicaecorum TaxID=501571 RepID=UPI00351FCD0C